MKKLGLLKFEDLYSIQSSLLVHDCFYGNAPTNIQNLVKRPTISDHLLRNQMDKPLDLVIPILKSRAGKNSFSANGPSFWNKLSTELRSVNQKDKLNYVLEVDISLIFNQV